MCLIDHGITFIVQEFRQPISMRGTHGVISLCGKSVDLSLNLSILQKSIQIT
ncbi:hypothetical protein BFX31_05880 [Vibrio paracholerae]|nr:hypothetical protein BFX31_05880 [Vibrio paracholerae]